MEEHRSIHIGINKGMIPDRSAFIYKIENLVFLGGIDPKKINIMDHITSEGSHYFPCPNPKQVEIIDDEGHSKTYGYLRGKMGEDYASRISFLEQQQATKR